MITKILIWLLFIYVDSVLGMTKTQAMDYLNHYGYMTHKNESNLSHCLKKFQKVASIPMTGMMDDVTNKMMEMPRCGCSDKTKMRVKRYSVQGSKWRITDIKYNINYPENLKTHFVHSSVYHAFKEWAKYTDISFSEVDKNEALLHISFTAMERPEMFGMAQFPIFGGNIAFNKEIHWSNDSTMDLQKVALHEIGHSLGLGHSKDNTSVMYPFYDESDTKHYLVKDDIEGIRLLYPPKN